MTSRDVSDASLLLRYSLHDKEKITSNNEFASLLQRYKQDPGFQETVSLVAEGLDLRVLPEHRDRLVLVNNTIDSAFANKFLLRVTTGTTTKERHLDGMMLAGIAIAFFPDRDRLDAGREPPVITAEYVDSLLRDLCQRFRSESNEGTMSNGEASLREAWIAYDELIPERATPKGTRGTQGTVGMLDKMMRHLANEGHLTKVPEGYRPTYAFATRLRHFGLNFLYDVLPQTRSESEESA